MLPASRLQTGWGAGACTCLCLWRRGGLLPLLRGRRQGLDVALLLDLLLPLALLLLQLLRLLLPLLRLPLLLLLGVDERTNFVAVGALQGGEGVIVTIFGAAVRTSVRSAKNAGSCTHTAAASGGHLGWLAVGACLRNVASARQERLAVLTLLLLPQPAQVRMVTAWPSCSAKGVISHSCHSSSQSSGLRCVTRMKASFEYLFMKSISWQPIRRQW